VSVNDSGVTMDRIRETWSMNRTKPLAGVVNSAIIATAPRTINTGTRRVLHPRGRSPCSVGGH
jgi:preprotein translocase subunit SecF